MEGLDPSLTKRLFETGGILLVLDVPENLEFGLDYQSWHIGPRFKGMKLIPPGIHFCFYKFVLFLWFFLL